jgi:hypothetical protein
MTRVRSEPAPGGFDDEGAVGAGSGAALMTTDLAHYTRRIAEPERRVCAGSGRSLSTEEPAGFDPLRGNSI